MYTIIQGDCLEGMRQLPDESIHCVVTSPPYYGLRDYGTATWIGGDADCNHTISNWSDNLKPNVSRPMGAHRGGSASHCHLCGAERIDQQIGLEDTPEAYVERLVNVFREVRRILRHDGTVWLNLGDSYMGGGGGNYNKTGISQAGGQHITNVRNRRSVIEASGLKAKDLIGIPWRVAFALQADGWWLRQDIIWHKPNPMPESVTDRCTKSHEYIFLLTKSAHYYYDHHAIMEPSSGTSAHPRFGGSKYGDNPDPLHATKSGNPYVDIGTRNRRSVWSVPTTPYPEAHFAVFPPKLIEPCILAGTSEYGCCITCGAPWEQSFVKSGEFQRRWSTTNADGSPYQSQGSAQNMYESTGWKPTCQCALQTPVPCTVFDPFTGSGTTAAVAIEHRRSFVGTELNPEYVALAEKRLSTTQVRMF